MEKLIFIKLGGSVITDKNQAFWAKEGVIARLGREIYEVSKLFKGKIIIGHGSGSFGHTFASKYKTHKGLIGKKSLEGLVKTADSAVQINRIVVKNLIKSGLKVISFAPSSFIFAKETKPRKYFVVPIKTCLEIGCLPVVYGDIVMDEDQGFSIFSTEKVISILIKGLSNDYDIDRVIQCGITDGVYNSNGNTIANIQTESFSKLKSAIGGSDSTDVTGGMLHKVEESVYIARKFGLNTVIINAQRRGELKKAILGHKTKSTTIHG